MFEILAKLIDWVSSLLVYLSQQQVKAANVRIKNCTRAIHATNKKLLDLEAYRLDLEAEREQMKAFLEQEATEL